MRDRQVCGKAQRAAHATQSCNVVQGLITLPDILLKMPYDAAEHIYWQVGNFHGRLVWQHVICHDDAALLFDSKSTLCLQKAHSNQVSAAFTVQLKVDAKCCCKMDLQDAQDMPSINLGGSQDML